MELAIDLGNTHLKWGLFSGDRLIDLGVDKVENYRPEEKLIQKLKAVVFSNTHFAAANLEEKFQKVPIVKDIRAIAPDFKTDYKTPDTLGSDRMAVCYAASKFFPKQAVLIIDAGSCITYDMVDERGIHRGGMISPGLYMRLRAMNQFTANLPLAEAPTQWAPMALSTRDSLSQGALSGCVYEMEGYISYVEDRFKNIKIIITGGDADLFVKFIKKEIFAEPNLVLWGLREIIKKYAE